MNYPRVLWEGNVFDDYVTSVRVRVVLIGKESIRYEKLQTDYMGQKYWADYGSISANKLQEILCQVLTKQ